MDKFCGGKKFTCETRGMRCSGGKVQIRALLSLPQLLFDLIEICSVESNNLLFKVRYYNSAFQRIPFVATKLMAKERFQSTFRD